jgi:hypothetical protein
VLDNALSRDAKPYTKPLGMVLMSHDDSYFLRITQSCHFSKLASEALIARCTLTTILVGSLRVSRSRTKCIMTSAFSDIVLGESPVAAIRLVESFVLPKL